ncbi:MAG: hypothetical protein ACKO6Q_04330 [Bacteroidota bacterium]
MTNANSVLIYQTSYEFVYRTWEAWLLSNEFTEVSVVQKNYPAERSFQRGDLMVGFAPLTDQESGQVYRIYMKQRQVARPGTTPRQ